MLIRYVYFTFPYTIYTIVSQFMLLVSYLIEPQAACQICPSDENFVQSKQEMLDNFTLDVAALVIWKISSNTEAYQYETIGKYMYITII